MAKFTIDVEMDDRWVNQFCSFLKEMEINGRIGHSAILGFYSDGDGDFRPYFDVHTEYEHEPAVAKHFVTDIEKVYDAG